MTSKIDKPILDIHSNDMFENKNFEITPLVKGLSGVISLPKDFDFKKERQKYLEAKYK